MFKFFWLLIFFSWTVYAENTSYKFILSSGPGSGSDQTVNVFATCFQKHNATIVKDFKPGAEGVLALRHLQQQVDTPTFVNVLVGNFGMSALSNFPGIDMLEDVHPVTYLNKINIVLVAKSPGLATMEELIELSKQRPVSVGTSFAAGTFLADKLFKFLNVKYQTVPYKNNTGAVVDILNGNLDIAVDVLTGVKPMIDSGKMKIITSTMDSKTAATHKHKNLQNYNPSLGEMPSGPILNVKPSLPITQKAALVRLVHLCNSDSEVVAKLDSLGSEAIIISTDKVKQIIKTAREK